MKLIKAFGKKMADFQAKILLSICFFLVVPIFALIVKSNRKKDKSVWVSWDMPSATLDDLRRQY